MIQGRFIRVAAALIAGFTINVHAKEFPAVPGEYVVKLKNTSMIMNTAAVKTLLGGPVRVINGSERLFVAQRPVIEMRGHALQTLSSNAMVEFAEPNFIYKVVGGATDLPNDAELKNLWGLVNTGQVVNGDMGSITATAGVDIDATRAWQIETGSADVLVAVIDTGVNWAHPDLADNIFNNTAEINGQAGVDDDGNGYVDDKHGYDFNKNDGDPMDVYGHGTHVAGTIGAKSNNGIGIAGVAWNVKILPIRFLGDDGSGSLENAVKSIDYAAKMNVKIMSNSWGGGGFSQALLESIQRAQQQGILFVAAAGNSGANTDSAPEYPAGYQVDNVISVAAIDPTGALADFSNFGKSSVHIAAPGANVYSYTMTTANALNLESWSGTSMACPHVTGVAVLLLSQDLTQTYDVIKSRLLASARPMPSLRGRVATGLVNAYFALTNTIAPLDPEDPFNWDKTMEATSTPHPYSDKTKQTYTFSVPGAKKVAVYFSKFETEPGYDKVVFKDLNGKEYGSISGKLGEAMGPAVDGDTVIMEFTSDDSVPGYGFDVGGVAYQN